MRILVAGASGALGTALSLRLIMNGVDVVGIDETSAGNDLPMKKARLQRLGIQCDTPDELPYDKAMSSAAFSNFVFIRTDIAKEKTLKKIFRTFKINKVAYLDNETLDLQSPLAAIQRDYIGFLNILENCRLQNIRHIVYNSSIAVYGKCDIVPTPESAVSDKPSDLFGAAKKANELSAYAYSKEYGISTAGMRFSYIYGPYVNSDSAVMLYPDIVPFDTESMLDFIHIDDAAEAIILALNKVIIEHNPSIKQIPARTYNVGSGVPVKFSTFMSVAKKFGLTPNCNDQQPEHIHLYADMSKIRQELQFSPSISFDDGMNDFFEWRNSSKNPLNRP